MPVQDLIKFTDKDASRIPVVLDGLDVEDWVAGDTLEITYNGVLFQRDDDDHTSLSDFITVVKSYDEVRFKSNGVKSPERGTVSVLDFVNEPPADVAKGAVYGVNAAPTGAFADHANEIATCIKSAPAALFRYSVPPWPGYIAYVRASGLFKTWSGAAWQDGLPQSFGVASIPAETSQAPRFIVQDILATPPVAPVSGQYWLGASSGCTGDWAGFENRIIKRVGTAWVSYAPIPGWKVTILTTGRDFVYALGAWQSAANPLIVAYPTRIVRSSDIVLAGSPPNYGVAPTTAAGIQLFPEGSDTRTTRKVLRVGNRLIINGRIDFSGSVPGFVSVGLFIDGQITADPDNYFVATVDSTYYEFEVIPTDTANHVYRIRLIGAASINAMKATMQFKEVTQ
jgi:hypothetical protein